MLGELISGGLALGKLLFGGAQNSMANDVVVPDVKFTKSPYAEDKLNLAKILYNSRMPGTAAAEGNILQNNANTAGGIRRNATDGAQALAMLTASQGITDDSFGKLRDQESNYKLNMLGNLNGAEDSMTQEAYKAYLDEVRTQEQKIAEKNGLRNAGLTNMGNGANELSAIGGNIDLLKALKAK